MIFDQKNKGFLSSCFTTDEEIFMVLNPSEKDREKQCFLILSLLSHNLTGKLIFSQKKSEEGIKFDCLLLLMLSNVDFIAFKLHFWCFNTGPKHPKCWNWKTSDLVVSISPSSNLLQTPNLLVDRLSTPLKSRANH